MDLVELQRFINNGIPEVKKRETTIFDIAGFPHFENVMSNVFAYFLDKNQKHNMGTLFLDALQDLLPLKGSLIIADYVVLREVTITDKKRIDIVIQEKSGNEVGKTIIIENKMFHHLNNDLDKYYDYFKCIDKDKQGIVLSINKLNITNPNYVNITHTQWLNKVWENIGSILLNVPDESLHMLKQFSKNLNNFAMTHETGKYFSFYNKNYDSIQEIFRLQTALDNQIWENLKQIENVIDRDIYQVEINDKWKCFYLKNDQIHDAFFTVGYNINTNVPHLKIILELQKEGLSKIEEIENLTKNEESSLIPIRTIEIEKLKKGHHYHFAMQEMILQEKDFENLPQSLIDFIEKSPMKPILEKIQNLFRK
jgi:hypothetical protein